MRREGEIPRNLTGGGEIPRDLAPGGRDHGGAKSLGHRVSASLRVVHSFRLRWTSLLLPALLHVQRFKSSETARELLVSHPFSQSLALLHTVSSLAIKVLRSTAHPSEIRFTYYTQAYLFYFFLFFLLTEQLQYF